MSVRVDKIGEVVWNGMMKCVETPPSLISEDCYSYCAMKGWGQCTLIACDSEERPDRKNVHYELVEKSEGGEK